MKMARDIVSHKCFINEYIHPLDNYTEPRGFQNLNPTPGVEFFISQGFTSVAEV